MKRYLETLDFLFAQLPMFQRQGGPAIKKDLGNIIALCKALGNPHHQLKCIHIAGTNGKGSTAHMISAILQSEGYQVGLYTSPHYRDFRERIKINGEYISKQEVVQFVEKNESLIFKIQPSFFEITVALAFDYFARQSIDYAIIETGLGGRLDSTNIINPLLSVITNISFDHMQFLGNTLPLIAGEKAGIIKKGTPVVISERQEETDFVFEEKAIQKDAPIFFASDLFRSELIETNFKRSRYNIYKSETIYFQDLIVEAYGNYQSKNILGVLSAIEELRKIGLKISDKSIYEGLANLKRLSRFMGRWEILSEAPLVFTDSGHNEAGIEEIMLELNKIKSEYLHIVLGTVKEKEMNKFLSYWPKNARYYFCKPDIPRGLDGEKLKELAADFSLKGSLYASVSEALDAAKKAAKKEDYIFVGGSTYVVAEVI